MTDEPSYLTASVDETCHASPSCRYALTLARLGPPLDWSVTLPLRATDETTARLEAVRLLRNAAVVIQVGHPPQPILDGEENHDE